ncbi:hypothetical protein CVV68_00830 [Arthrobacter livingstonensis]|uniref:Uncharacterized protein n=1 Tax=Arthrobacter livingstonensis TaxID=670078 RepID=A0A2V5LZW5_9MICC|nr:hypothetical protein [Arthrobacter livingstonensis]PYI69687.1 hypothetical protein CVV68_00830 [Arthrobacter livingstonensis]
MGTNVASCAAAPTTVATGPPMKLVTAKASAATGTHTGTALAIRSPTDSISVPSVRPARNTHSSTVPST